MGLARKWGKETLAGGGLNNKQFNDFVPASDPLPSSSRPPSTTWTPRVLKDGSDSVGALGALNRVYINIGLFSEEWLLHFRPIIGGQKITPIEIAVARKNSVYWGATEMQTPVHGALLPARIRSALSERRARQRKVPDRRRGHRQTRQGGVRRHLRPLPLEQAARPSLRASTSRTPTARTT